MIVGDMELRVARRSPAASPRPPSHNLLTLRSVDCDAGTAIGADNFDPKKGGVS